MPLLTQYYLDADNLSLATCVFTDAALTIVAPGGYYSDGVIIRYQTITGALGTLSAAEYMAPTATTELECPTCEGSDCVDTVTAASSNQIRIQSGYRNISSTDLTATYRASIGTGSATTGAVIIRFYFLNQYGAGAGIRLVGYANGQVVGYTNNFSASGSNPGTLAAAGTPNMGGDDGGWAKGINNEYPFEYTSTEKFVYVGAAGSGVSGIYGLPGVDPCGSVNNWMQIPNNGPNYGSPPTTPIANPQNHGAHPFYEWLQSPGGAVPAGTYGWQESLTLTPTITIDQEQSQLEGLSFNNVAGGYKGWYTAVYPKTNAGPLIVRAELQLPACGAQGGFHAVIHNSCPVLLEAITHEMVASGGGEGAPPITTYCSEPVATLAAAAALGELNTAIYNVPGAQGANDVVNPIGALQDTYEFGIPNRWDLVFYDQFGSTPVNPTNTPVWVKYLNNTSQPRFFEVINGVITQTNVEFVATPTEVEKIITPTGPIGGGIYQIDVNTTVATGACAIYIWTGNNPKGLFIRLLEDDGTEVLRTNSFAVRGSMNQDGDLTEAYYILDSESGTYSQTGAQAGGSGYTLGSGTSLQLAQYFEEGTGNSEETRLDGHLFNYCTLGYNESIYGLRPSYTYQGTPLEPNSANGDSEIYRIEMPIYIGMANSSNLPISAIPCTTNEGQGAIDCGLAFVPMGGGSTSSNILGNINLPDNGNHSYSGIAAPDYELAYAQCELEIDMGDTIFGIMYPTTVTGCDSCGNRLKMYDDLAGFLNTSIMYNVVVTQPQVQLYGDGQNTRSPGWTMAVIPKTSANNQKVRVEITSLTSNTLFHVKVKTPAALPAIAGGVYLTASAGPGMLSAMCTAGAGAGAVINAYVAHNAYGGPSNNGLTSTTDAPCIPGVAGTNECAGAGVLANDVPYVNDMVFTDVNGENPLAAGTYFFIDPAGPTTKWFTTDEFGVVRCVKSCVDQVPCN